MHTRTHTRKLTTYTYTYTYIHSHLSTWMRGWVYSGFEVIYMQLYKPEQLVYNPPQPW